MKNYNNNNNNCLMAIFPGLSGWYNTRRNIHLLICGRPHAIFWVLWCKGKVTEADELTKRLDTTPSGLLVPHLHHPHKFYARCPSCRKPPNIYPGLGHAPSMLGCIPGGLVHKNMGKNKNSHIIQSPFTRNIVVQLFTCLISPDFWHYYNGLTALKDVWNALYLF